MNANSAGKKQKPEKQSCKKYDMRVHDVTIVIAYKQCSGCGCLNLNTIRV